MKKSKLTYAQRAKQIIAKYKRRLGDDFEKHDKMAVEAMNRELSKLMEQQEEAKQQTVQNMYSEMAYGGNINEDSYRKMLLKKKSPEDIEAMNQYLIDSYQRARKKADDTGARYYPTGNYYDKQFGSLPFTADFSHGRNIYPGTRDITMKEISNIPEMEISESEAKRVGLTDDEYKRILRHTKYSHYSRNFKKAYGGTLPQLDGTGLSFIPPKEATFEDDPFQIKLSSPTAFDMSAYGPENQAYFKSLDYLTKNHSGTKPANKQSNAKQSWWSEIPTESKVGAISQLAGVLGSGAISLFAGKPKPLTFNPTEAPEMSYVDNSEQLAAAKRSYRGAANSLRYLSPSQYAAAMSNLAAQEAATKAGIIEGTNNTNVGIKNDAAWRRTALDQSNEQTRMRVEAMNEAARLGHVNNIGQMLTNTAGVISGFAKDESMRKTQNDMMRFMGTSNYGSKVINGRTVPTNRLGSLEYYTDPQGNPHWEDGGQPISQAQFLKKVEEHYKRLNP